LNRLSAIALFALTSPAFAQYGGPAVLTRGQAPAAMATSQIDFRPFLSVTGGYDYGLNGVGIDPNGQPYNVSSFNVQATGGISGLHSWRHTQLGIDFTASIRHFPGHSFYDGFDQRLLLSLSHQFSRHVSFGIRANAGFFTQAYNRPELPSTIPFDPSTTYVPTSTFFDNRVAYYSLQADLHVQKSTRLSYMIGGDSFSTHYRSSALYGALGAGARGDVQYRLSRRSTIGAAYNYVHYRYTGVFSGTDVHSILGVYSVRLNRAMELSVAGGAAHFETKFIQSVPVDPAIAALIGLNSLNQVSYTKDWIGSGLGRFSYTMKRGVAYIGGGRQVTPGNGLFLTSTSNNVTAGYSYTALRKWSANASANYTRSDSIGNFQGAYANYGFNLSVSRQVARYTHGVLSFDARKYQSPDFHNYNLWQYSIRLGLGFTPGDIPLRLW